MGWSTEVRALTPIPAFPLKRGRRLVRGLLQLLGQSCVNHIDYAFNVLQHVVVPEAQYLPSLLLKPCCSYFVILQLFGVLATVNFDDQLCFKTGEVQYEISKGMLPPKFHVENLLHPETTPQMSLGICHFAA